MTKRTLIQDMEQRIAKMVIQAGIDNGFDMMINDGEDNVTPWTTDPSVLFDAMFSTDEDMIYFRKGLINHFVYFVYGNEGYDVISDYSVALEEVLKPVNEFTRQYY